MIFFVKGGKEVREAAVEKEKGKDNNRQVTCRIKFLDENNVIAPVFCYSSKLFDILASYSYF